MDKKKVRFKLNLFDGIVLALGLCAVLVLGYMMLKPAPAQQEGSTANSVTYTVRLEKVLEGAGLLINPGDELEDTIKNYKLGKVVSVEILPCTMPVEDHINKRGVSALIEGYENVLVTVEGSGNMGENAFLLDGGYALRVNTMMYVKGSGYMGSGPVVSIERGVA